MIRKRSDVQAGTGSTTAAPEGKPEDSKVAAAPKEEAKGAVEGAHAELLNGQSSKTTSSIAVSAEGDEVTACYGIDKYSPVQYNTFEHGPFFVKTKVRANETIEDASARAWNAVVGLAKGSFPGKAQEYLANLKKLGIIVKDAGGELR